jgi:hypothetical protein
VRPNIGQVVGVLDRWQVNDKPTTIDEFLERTRSSGTLIAMEAEQKGLRDSAKVLEDIRMAVNERLKGHPVTKALAANRMRNDQPEFTTGRPWNPSAPVVLRDTLVIAGLRFNLGNLELAPLVELEVDVWRVDTSLCFEVTARSTSIVDSQEVCEVDCWKSSFAMWNAEARAWVEDAIDKALIFLERHLMRHPHT